MEWKSQRVVQEGGYIYVLVADSHCYIVKGLALGEGNGNPLQCSCLENPTEGGAWWATVHGVAKGSDTSEQLNDNDKRVWHS